MGLRHFCWKLLAQLSDLADAVATGAASEKALQALGADMAKGNGLGARSLVEARILLMRPTGDSPCASNPGGLLRILGPY